METQYEKSITFTYKIDWDRMEKGHNWVFYKHTTHTWYSSSLPPRRAGQDNDAFWWDVACENSKELHPVLCPTISSGICKTKSELCLVFERPTTYLY